MKIKPVVILVILFQIAIFFQSSASGPSARMVIETAVNEIIAIIKDPMYLSQSSKDRQKESLYAKAMDTFDFKTLSRLALGKRFTHFSDGQKKEFSYYFSKLITDIYFEKMAGTNVENIKVAWVAERELKEKKSIRRADVESQILQNDIKIPVIYRMMKKPEEKWQVYDIKIEGVSMAANYREQYRQRISDTPEIIIAELKKKVEK
ncbi:MAG: ABC transporter substrate-binding protein [Desulfobacteraceae bacterium]|nr:ABC transporter substrate-binding protein [Desulfobacteraceae bacterium]